MSQGTKLEVGYPQIVEWIAEDILGSTESFEDIEANVDRYMEDLLASVQQRAEHLGKEQFSVAE